MSLLTRDEVFAELAADLLEAREARQRQREQDIDEYLANRRALHFPSEAIRDEYVRVLDDDPDDDVPVEGGFDGEVETASDRLLNHAHAEGLVYASDLDDGPVVLFAVLDESTMALFSPEQRAAYPKVRAFPACPGLALQDLAGRFHAAGLDIDDYAPTTSTTWKLTAEEFETLTDPEVPADVPEPKRNDEPETDDTLNIDEDDRRLLGLLDFEALLSGEQEPNVWLVPGLIQRGLLYQLVAAPKTGKSLLVLELAHRVAAGLDGLTGAELPEGDASPDGPASVLYLDAENSPKIVGDRLREMGVEPASLARLHYASFPALAPLDSERGAGDLLALARHVDAQLVVLDTVSRFVSGNENDAQTYLDLYRLTLAPLKREGRAVIRIDHTGKDAALGARGSSAKGGDVDVSWILTKGQTPARVKLTREFDRTHSHPDVIDLHRRQAPLRHEVVTGKVSLADLAVDEVPTLDDLEDSVRALVEDMNARNVPSRVGRDKAREAYLAAGGEIKASNGVWADAVAFRKRTAQL
ncbi:AAA family ATPase [Rhodococcus sp. ACT016]|uniref:AAA family ATPase n=1 Tax=Rhodococcus sp. ACT016 TaxID=3134808 RepID=UPI003D2B48FA